MYTALLRKELRAARTLLGVALPGGLLAIAGAAIALRYPGPLVPAPHTLAALLHGMALFCALLVAAQLVADERHNGTLTPLVALPLPLLHLWLAKFLLGAVASLAGGMALILPAAAIGIPVTVTPAACLHLFACYCLAFAVSCLCRNTLNAVLLGLICFFLYGTADVLPLPRPGLVRGAGTAVLLLGALLFFMRRQQGGARC